MFIKNLLNFNENIKEKSYLYVVVLIAQYNNL